MRLVLQRVSRACVRVNGAVHAGIGRGLLVLVGVHASNTEASANALAARVATLRCFNDASGRMNLGAAEAGADFLVVSQFTLCADLSRGRRPSFEPAMAPAPARALYERFAAALARCVERPVQTGVFGADMQIELINDGPVTFVLDEPPSRPPDHAPPG